METSKTKKDARMKDKLLALLKTLGILTDDKVQTLSAELDKLDLEKGSGAQNIDPTKVTDPALRALIEGLQNNNAILTQQMKTLTDTMVAERTEREKAVKLQQDQAKTAHETKVTELVAKALKEGKITKAKEEWLKKYAGTDLAEAEAWVKDAPVAPGFKPEQTKESSNKEGEGDKVLSPLSGVNPSILSKVNEMAGLQNN
ncbi:MAG: phage protease [Bacteroidota bacterium]